MISGEAWVKLRKGDAPNVWNFSCACCVGTIPVEGEWRAVLRGAEAHVALHEQLVYRVSGSGATTEQTDSGTA